MTGDMSELEALAFHWADAYLLSYSRDRWVALRRDTRRFLIAGTLTGLKHAIQDDYRHHPVSPASDPPGTTDCLNLDDGYVPARRPRPTWHRTRSLRGVVRGTTGGHVRILRLSRRGRPSLYAQESDRSGREYTSDVPSPAFDGGYGDRRERAGHDDPDLSAPAGRFREDGR